METKPNLFLLSILAVLTMTAVIYSGIGWWHHMDWRDAIYLALRSTDGGLKYEELEQNLRNNFFLQSGRFLGAFVEPLAFSVVFVSLFSKNMVSLLARWGRSGHIVVVGESAFADKLSEHRHQAIKIVHFRGADDEAYKKGCVIQLPFTGVDPKDLHEGGATKAAGIVIAPENDARAIDLGIAAQRLFPRAQVTVRLRDFWLAERLHNTPGADRLRALSEPRLAARFIVRCYPPFLLAGDLGHPRIHTLLIGDHDWLEAAMSETILSARTLKLGKPVFSFICTEPEAFRTRLARRYPALADQADLHVYAAEPIEGIDIFSTSLADIATPAPVTAVYCLFGEGARSLSNALAFIQQARETASFEAPVFVLSGGSSDNRPPPASQLTSLQIVPFGDTTDLADASGVLAAEPDVAARAFHAAYVNVAPATKDAATPWETLTEEFRVSNRRAVSHMYAKLFEAGFDLRSWMAKHDIWRELPAVATGEVLYRNDDELQHLMLLEHERWTADRCMSGWQYGEKRDKVRKRHDDMKPFDELTPEVQAYDGVSIVALRDLLEPKEGGVRRL